MKATKRMRSYIIGLGFLLVSGLPFASTATGADQLTEEAIDTVIERAMNLFEVPGMAVSVVHDGKVVYSRYNRARKKVSVLPA